METLKAIVLTVLFLGLSISLGKNIFIGLKTGTIRYKDTISKCSKTKNPIGFWSLVLLFSFFIATLIFAWISIMKELL